MVGRDEREPLLHHPVDALLVGLWHEEEEPEEEEGAPQDEEEVGPAPDGALEDGEEEDDDRGEGPVQTPPYAGRLGPEGLRTHFRWNEVPHWGSPSVMRDLD